MAEAVAAHRRHLTSTPTTAARYRPTLAEVAALSAAGNLIPIYREIVADLETPVSAFLKVARGRYAFLLESVEGGERLARYSFIGADPFLTLELRDGQAVARFHGHRESAEVTGPPVAFGGLDYYGYPASERRFTFDDPLVALRQYLESYKTVSLPGMPRFLGGAVGYLSYEAVRYFERLPVAPVDPLGFPDGFFMFVDSMLVFDHLERTIKVVSHVHVDKRTPLEQSYGEAVDRIERLVARLNGPVRAPLGREPIDERPLPDRLVPNVDQATYEAMVGRAKEYIAAGDIIQVVLSQRQALHTGAHSFTVYRALRRVNPSPYMFYLQLGDDHLIGSSPEMLVRLDGERLLMHPIAGTRRRGRTDEEDEALANELANDEKERAEHIMLVDLGRNDIGRVSRPGTVRVPKLMEIERYSHVMHLVSHVTGILRPDLTGLDALRACFPAGTVSGAPKIRAMEIIAELEPERRGPYSGAVGYVDFGGNLDTAITLRTIVMRGQTAYLQAGAGIVADSVPELEHKECHHKMRALVRAIELAEEMERELREGGTP